VPLYEYECRKCKHRFERIQRLSEPRIENCPRCKGGKVRKLLSRSAVHFKGSGWYVTDYAKKKAPPEEAGASDGKKDKEAAGKKPAKESKPDSGKKGSEKD
jgi:putative FmdB family regulatory protein